VSGQELAGGIEELDRVQLAERQVADKQRIALGHDVFNRLTVCTDQADQGHAVSVDPTSGA
jgi:hypothetical protein